jgi:predicted hydrocarbon binding protein
MEDRNKDVMIYRFDPKKKHYLVSLRLENKPGELGNLANMLGIRGINILEGFFGGMTYGQKANMGFFVETTNDRMDADWLKDYLKSAVGVSDVEVKSGIEGFLSDTLNFPVTWNNGQRAVVLRVEALNAMILAVKATENGNNFAYEQGMNYGKWSWESLLAVHRPKTKEGLQEMLGAYTATGWGMVQLLDLDSAHRKARLKIENGFECMGPPTGRVGCYFTGGHFAGAFSVLFGTLVACEETKCVSKGDSHCEFSMSA